MALGTVADSADNCCVLFTGIMHRVIKLFVATSSMPTLLSKTVWFRRAVFQAWHFILRWPIHVCKYTSRNSMQLEYNYNPPHIMHIDLNSCFAIIEQQANPLLRNKPVAIAAYDTPGGMILASSYEAKARGVKLGVNVREARQLASDICIRMPDPAKYRDAHRRFKQVLLQYTDDITPKSIDEFVLDLTGSPSLCAGMTMQAIGKHIKNDIKKITRRVCNC